MPHLRKSGAESTCRAEKQWHSGRWVLHEENQRIPLMSRTRVTRLKLSYQLTVLKSVSALYMCRICQPPPLPSSPTEPLTRPQSSLYRHTALLFSVPIFPCAVWRRLRTSQHWAHHFFKHRRLLVSSIYKVTQFVNLSHSQGTEAYHHRANAGIIHGAAEDGNKLNEIQFCLILPRAFHSQPVRNPTNSCINSDLFF